MLPLEKHYTVRELAVRWHLSQKFLRAIFLKEPGVIIIYNPKPNKRIFRSLRIPESVAERVYRRLQLGGRAA